MDPAEAIFADIDMAVLQRGDDGEDDDSAFNDIVDDDASTFSFQSHDDAPATDVSGGLSSCPASDPGTVIDSGSVEVEGARAESRSANTYLQYVQYA